MAGNGRHAGGGGGKTFRFSQHLDLDGQLEVLQLKEKLQEMTDMVRQLLQHMDQLEKIHPFFSTEAAQRDSVATQTIPVSPLIDEKSLEMSPTLKIKMKELVDMNINWQKYNALQEKHIQELHNKVEQMQQKLTTAEDNSQSQKQQVDWQLHDENNRLKADMENLRLQNRTLKAAIEAKGNTSKDTERGQVLEAQLLLYKEDFQTERKDREAAQARVVQLEMELLELTKKMKTTSTGFHYRVPHHAVDSDLQVDGDLQVDAECHHITTKRSATDCADGPSSKVVLPADSNKETSTTGKLSRLCIDKKPPATKEDTLSCTKCVRVYPKSKHLDLLDHLEECDRR